MQWEREWKVCGLYGKAVLLDLIIGIDIVVKKPWKPEKGKAWFSINVDNEGNPYVSENTWANSVFVLGLYALGNCFRTRKEAEKYQDKFVDYLKNKEPDTSWRD